MRTRTGGDPPRRKTGEHPARRTWHVYLMDFGIAYRPESGEMPLPPGIILGTPAYLTEQAQGGQTSVLPASDQYSLGVVLYELLCGRPPFCGLPSYVMFHTIHHVPPSPRSFAPQYRGLWLPFALKLWQRTQTHVIETASISLTIYDVGSVVTPPTPIIAPGCNQSDSAPTGSRSAAPTVLGSRSTWTSVGSSIALLSVRFVGSPIAVGQM